jgi:arylsulfatase A
MIGLRNPARVMAIIAIMATAVLFAGLGVAQSTHATERPNVVVLLADDLGSKDIGCYGGPVKTPVLDRLAAEGVRFTNFYSGAPVCSPARAVLMTGRQHMRTGVYTVIQDHLHDMYLLKREVTIAEHLKASGYQTVHLGKWHLGTPFRRREKPWIDEHGFDYWFATDLNAAPSHRDPVNFWRNRKPVGKIERYACQIVVDEAITWLDEKRDTDKPFFLNIWFHEPHAPLAAPDSIVSQYGKLDDPAAIYSATIDNTDRAIGRLIEKLKAIGQLDNTIIFYTSDHGSYRPERNGELKGSKGSLFEGGLRTPGIFYWPKGIASGSTEDIPGAAVDLLPTLCGLIGLEPPKNVKLDGTDLSPLLTDKGAYKRDVPLFWVSPTSQPIVVIRDGRYSFVGHRKSEFPRDQEKIDTVMVQMEAILDEELKLGRKLTQREVWDNAYNYECGRDDWKKLRSEFVTLNTFQESWCPLIKAGSGGFSRFELYDLVNDPNQTQDVSRRFPVDFDRLKKLAIQLHAELMEEAVDWSDPKSVAAVESSIEEQAHIHRLETTYRSVFDAFAYVNRIPVEPESEESEEDLAGRILGRLANQEGRVLIKLPPGMDRQAYQGFKLALEGGENAQSSRCVACHHLPDFGQPTAATPIPSLRNLSYSKERLRQLIQNETHKDVQINNNDVDLLHAFLHTLSDVSNTKFRELIVEATASDVSGVEK